MPLVRVGGVFVCLLLPQRTSPNRALNHTALMDEAWAEFGVFHYHDVKFASNGLAGRACCISLALAYSRSLTLLVIPLMPI